MYKLSVVIFFTILLLISSEVFSQYHPFNRTRTLDINNIQLMQNNVGSANHWGARWQLLPTNNEGLVWEHGIRITGKINNQPAARLINWYFSAYSPGPILDGQPAFFSHPEDSLRYRVYKVTEGDDTTNIDYAEWPVDFGAPVDQEGNPLILGDQILWTAYNALDSTVNPEYFKQTELPIEIHQIVFAKEGFLPDYQDIFSNVVFLEWTLINKGSEEIDSTYIGFWTDIDFFDLLKNFPGVDTSLQLGYCWNYDDPAAVGYTLLYGPVVPAPGEDAIYKGRKLENYKNLPLNTFKPIMESAGSYDPIFIAPDTIIGIWNNARGYDNDGNIIIDPTTGNPTTFPVSGDPVTGEGWIFTDDYNGTGFEAGFSLYAGPFQFAPNDTQWVMLALVPATGYDGITSITHLREKVSVLQSLPYDSLAFGKNHYGITSVEDISEIPIEYKLNQNYPNPFNPKTLISYKLPEYGNVKLKIFDLLGKEITTLVDEEKPAGFYEVEFFATGLPSGIYFYQLRAGNFIDTKKMILLK